MLTSLTGLEYVPRPLQKIRYYSEPKWTWYSNWDHQGSNLGSCVCKVVLFHLSNHPLSQQVSSNLLTELKLKLCFLKLWEWNSWKCNCFFEQHSELFRSIFSENERFFHNYVSVLFRQQVISFPRYAKKPKMCRRFNNHLEYCVIFSNRWSDERLTGHSGPRVMTIDGMWLKCKLVIALNQDTPSRIFVEHVRGRRRRLGTNLKPFMIPGQRRRRWPGINQGLVFSLCEPLLQTPFFLGVSHTAVTHVGQGINSC